MYVDRILMKYNCTIHPVSDGPGWTHYVVIIRDYCGKVVYTFDRGLSSPGNSIFFQFYRNKTNYAIVGEKYNSIKIVELPDFNNIKIVPDWNPDFCPLNYRLLTNDLLLVHSAIWGGSDCSLEIINLDTLKFMQVPWNGITIYDFDGIDCCFTKDGNELQMQIPTIEYSTFNIEQLRSIG